MLADRNINTNNEAAPPERVSDSLTNEVRCGNQRGHYLTEVVKDAIWELRAEGGSEARSGGWVVEADGEQVFGEGGRDGEGVSTERC